MSEAPLETPVTLPPILATIADVAGLEAALKIARAHGGTRVTIPTLADGHNWLTELVDADQAAMIIEALGSANRVDLPLPPGGSSWREWHRQRNRRIAELQEQNATAPEIARAMGMTQRAVHYRRAAQRQRASQGLRDLFEE